MTITNLGMTGWSMRGDDGGHRHYVAEWLIESTDPDNGPLSIIGASGLPTLGSYWTYGNDNDLWAFCTPEWDVESLYNPEPTQFWKIRTPFTTKTNSKRCYQNRVEDPMDEPYDIGGSFVGKQRKNGLDKDGNPICSSSYELLKGDATEIDDGRPTVEISFNSADIDLNGICGLMHHLNDSTLWGCPARCVKASRFNWSRKFYGSCTYYFQQNFGFDIDPFTFDREVYDIGTMVLAPGGDEANPKDFIPAKAITEDKKPFVFLDGHGNEVNDLAEAAVKIIRKYGDANLLLLGIPSSLTA